MYRISEEEKNVYRQIYQISAENKKAAGEEFAIWEDAFVLYSGLEPDRVNCEVLAKTEVKDFISLVFMTVMKRVIDDESKKDWESRIDKMEDRAFKTMLIKRILPAKERQDKQIKLYNNVLTLDTSVRRARFESKVEKVLNFMYCKIYLKLPEGLRLGIRKIRRRLIRR